ncbi:MAG TPA: hypothetical protein VHF89_14110 [Solirubrobacteraceae bacterium]|nr:hypothetical protein [Solirubrobacteraceae bacterium]
MRALPVASLAAAAAAASVAAAAPAHAGCLPRDARLVLAGADAGIVGTVEERRDAEYEIQVERAAKGGVPTGDLVVHDAGALTSVALQASPGERLGLALHRDGEGWSATGCDRTPPEAMLRAGASAPPCEAGGAVVQPTRVEHVLGCVGPVAAPLELRAHRLRRRGGSTLCVDLVDLAFGVTSGCGTHRVHGRAPARVQGTMRFGGRLTLSGPARPAVRGVRVRYRTRSGQRRTLAAGFVAVTDRALLRRLRVRRPFGQFVAILPHGARRVRLTALDARGRSLGPVRVPRGLGVPR